jgi:hypothetical protein
VNIPTINLKNGSEMPVLGNGTWLGLDEKVKSSGKKSILIVKEFIFI